jgi:hypothetical protein
VENWIRRPLEERGDKSLDGKQLCNWNVAQLKRGGSETLVSGRIESERS